ncbi:MAG: type II secretion system protein GspL [Betaproteobacteria bacterium]
MNLLRIYCPLREVPSRCQWALLDDKGKAEIGVTPLSGLPRRVDRIQLVVPAADVLITRARLPAAARRAGSPVLAFAVEERTVSEPDANHVSWLGTVGDQDALAVLDRQGLERWRAALNKVGINSYEVHSEMLLLPCASNEWSVAWGGQEGFVRTGKLEAGAIDSGDRDTPPLSLRLMLERALANGNRPSSIALYTATEDAMPALEAWQSGIGVPIRSAGLWNWRSAPTGEGVGLAQETPRWRGVPATISKLRLAAWIAGAALALHAIALVIDWSLLASEQRNLRRQMDSQFRITFPDAVAVVDPLLQMRRKLAEARHVAGQPDMGDFLPMIEKVVSEMKDLPRGTVRIVSYEGGRVTLEFTTADAPTIDRIVARLRQAGLSADSSSAAAGSGRAVLTVRAS